MLRVRWGGEVGVRCSAELERGWWMKVKGIEELADRWVRKRNEGRVACARGAPAPPHSTLPARQGMGAATRL